MQTSRPKKSLFLQKDIEMEENPIQIRYLELEISDDDFTRIFAEAFDRYPKVLRPDQFRVNLNRKQQA